MTTKHTPTPWHLGRVKYRHFRNCGPDQRNQVESDRVFKHPNGKLSYGICIFAGESNPPFIVAELLEDDRRLDRGNIEETAKFIVRACNSHEKLLTSLNKIASLLKSSKNETPECEAYILAEQAIANAERES